MIKKRRIQFVRRLEFVGQIIFERVCTTTASSIPFLNMLLSGAPPHPTSNALNWNAIIYYTRYPYTSISNIKYRYAIEFILVYIF